MKTIHTLLPSPAHSCLFAQPVDKIAFFDIETTGLSPKASSLYLIGAARYDMEKKLWSLTQWFADDYRSEADILTSFFDFLQPCEALYHFNGAAFDVPYVLSKCEKHQLSPSSHCLELMQNTSSHQTLPGKKAICVDLLKAIRPLKKKLHLLKANQTALERWLGISRKDQYNGRQLISVYAEYMQKKILHSEEADELERLLLLHNHDDMAGMLEICSLLSYYDCLHPASPPAVQNVSQGKDSLSISFDLACPVPNQLLLEHVFAPEKLSAGMSLTTATLSLQKDTGTLTIPVYQGTLKYFFAPYSDYYYLPEEDNAIHKSVAQFVDPAFRKKATAATCYTKKEGSFLPSFATKQTAWESSLFYQDYKTKPACYLLEDLLSDSRNASPSRQLSQYLFYELPHF